MLALHGVMNERSLRHDVELMLVVVVIAFLVLAGPLS